MAIIRDYWNKNSNWWMFAEMFGIGKHDLNYFADLMGYDGFYDLDLSITPRWLYKQDPKKFIRNLKKSSMYAETLDDKTIKELIKESIT